MVTRALLLGIVLALGIVALVGPIAPTVSATHACGFEPCPHPSDVFCFVVFKKFTPSLYYKFCPYA